MKVIELTKGFCALVDDEDFAALAQWRWQTGTAGYAIRTTGRGKEKKTITMHRVIMGMTDPSVFADHINGDPRDNRKCNLRKATHSQNMRNSSYKRKHDLPKGVYSRPNGKFQASLNEVGHRQNLGTFSTIEEASAAYNAAAAKTYGEFARLN